LASKSIGRSAHFVPLDDVADRLVVCVELPVGEPALAHDPVTVSMTLL
jgi:hypothetical protein